MSEYTDYCLKADSEAELATALPFARTNDENGQEVWVLGGENYALDLIGDVVAEPAVTDENGNITTPAVLADGFHSNLRIWGSFQHDLSAVLLAPQPTTPVRAFA